MSEVSKSTSLLIEQLVPSWFSRNSDAAILDEWIFWNNSPSRHVPLMTLKTIFPEKFYNILEQDSRVRAQVDRVLRSKFSWNAPVSWNPQDPLLELSMAAPHRFQRLAFLASALSMKEVLGKIIDGAVVRKLRQEIGEDIMEFVLLSGSLNKYSFAECTAHFPLSEEPCATLQQRAILFIEDAFSGKESGVQQRIASKMPGAFLEGIKNTASPLAAKTEELLSRLWKEANSWL